MKISRKEWESNFFDKTIYTVTFSEIAYASEKNLVKELGQLEEELQFLPKNLILETVLSTKNLNLAYHLEEFGFRLLDSKFRFISKVDKKGIDLNKRNHLKNLSVREFSSKTDLKDILKLTAENISNNDAVTSRYKSIFFSRSEMKKYYSNWIRECAKKNSCMISVAVECKSNQLVGFFIYDYLKEYLEYPLYKGILTAVDGKWRGNNLQNLMQQVLFKLIPHDQFFIDNTTQLSNINVIKNHFRMQKKPHNIELIFLFKPNN